MSGILCALAGGGRPMGVVGYSESTSASAATLSLTLPAGTLPGDLLVAVMVGAASGPAAVTWTGDTSWTERRDYGVLPSLRVATLLAGPGDVGPFVFTPSATAAVTGQIIALRGVDYDTVGAIIGGTGNGLLSGTSITMTAPGIMIGMWGASATSTATFTTPTGMTLIRSTVGNPRLQTFSEIVNTGATGPRSSTVGSATSAPTAVLLIGAKAV